VAGVSEMSTWALLFEIIGALALVVAVCAFEHYNGKGDQK
jgi:hypothetical protein